MAIAAINARTELFSLIEKLDLGDPPIVITSKAGNAVLISESEYGALLETIHIMSSPTNYSILLESIAEFKDRKGIVVDLPLLHETPNKRVSKKVAAKIDRLISSACENPSQRIGKPEALKYD